MTYLEADSFEQETCRGGCDAWLVFHDHDESCFFSAAAEA
jgi:hypothetical protein